MNNTPLGDLAQSLANGFFSGSVLPRQLFDLLAAGAGGDRDELQRLLEEAWTRGNKARAAQGMPPLDIGRPFLLSRGSGGSGNASVAPSERRPSRPAEPELDAAGVAALVRESFGLDAEGIARVNGGRQLDEQMLFRIVDSGIRAQRIVPRLLKPYFGPPGKYFEKFKELLRIIVEQRDGNMPELMQHFGIYLLVNGAPPEMLSAMQLAPPLEAFVSDRIGRMRQIFYVGMLFAYTFTFVLFAQAFEINAKYRDMADDQRAKLRKLYEAEDRLALLVANAGNVAMRRISEFGVEAREIQMALKKFLGANKRLVVPSDLFSEERP